MAPPRNLGAAILVSCLLVTSPWAVPILADDSGSSASLDGAVPHELSVPGGGLIEVPMPAPGLTVEAAFDGGLLEPLEGNTITAPARGNHWLAVASRDAAGRLSPIRWVRVRVDGDGPITRISFEPEPVSDGEQLWLPAGSVALVSAEDEGSGVAAVQIAAGHEEALHSIDPPRAVVEGASLTRIDLPERSEVTVRAISEDAVGNVGPQAERKVIIDPLPPTGSLRWSGPVAEASGDNPLALGPEAGLLAHVHDVGSGVVRWSLTLQEGADPIVAGHVDEGATLPLDGQIADLTPRLADGMYQARLVAWDRVGFESTVVDQPFLVDTTPPSIEGVILDEQLAAGAGPYRYPMPFQLEVRAADSGSGLAEVRADFGGAIHEVSPGQVLTVTTPVVILTARDAVGNMAQDTIDLTRGINIPRGERPPAGTNAATTITAAPANSRVAAQIEEGS